MKLLMKRDTSMEHSRFIIYDSSGHEKYRVTGATTASSDKMVISSADGKAMLSIRIVRLPMLSACNVTDGKERFRMTSYHSRSSRRQIQFHGISWNFCESRDRRSFEILDLDGTSVMSVSADRYLSTGTLELSILCESRELFCLAAVVFACSVNLADAAATAPI